MRKAGSDLLNARTMYQSMRDERLPKELESCQHWLNTYNNKIQQYREDQHSVIMGTKFKKPDRRP